MDVSALRSQLIEIASVVGIRGAVDIVLMSSMVYAGLVWARRTRVSNVIRGALTLGAVYLGARQFDLGMTAAVLEAFFVVLLVAAVVIYRDELRALVERVASLSRRAPGLSIHPPKRQSNSDQLRSMLTRSLVDLAEAKIGALVVLQGRDSLDIHLQGGVTLDGEPSEPLIKSIFDPHSMGHDGAVVIEEGRLRRFAVHLPMSTNFERLGHRGTRHAAGLGLSEQADALCLVVSEERGEITAMTGGELELLDDGEALAAVLDRHLGTAEEPPARSWWSYLRGDWWTKLAAVTIAGLLWVVLVHGASPAQHHFTLPVEVADLGAGKELSQVVPKTVTVTMSGARRDFYFVSPSRLRVVLSLPNAPLGTSSVAVSEASLSHPQGLSVQRILPNNVAVVVRRRLPPKSPKP
ncbi:MAG: DNA integrity scanning protein DisA nucleotide-binding domain protein [Deltaproteobacteria bacterium]|nr:DNA integrity scanning protein DisA nucleotide-binding domain protein [Deltaproteobacteria bacterium]